MCYDNFSEDIVLIFKNDRYILSRCDCYSIRVITQVYENQIIAILRCMNNEKITRRICSCVSLAVKPIDLSKFKWQEFSFLCLLHDNTSQGDVLCFGFLPQ